VRGRGLTIASYRSKRPPAWILAIADELGLRSGSQIFCNDADLLEDAQSVGLQPRANDFIVGELVDDDPLIGHFPLARRKPVKYSLVGPVPLPANRSALAGTRVPIRL
jgi:hypothetical protein